MKQKQVAAGNLKRFSILVGLMIFIALISVFIPWGAWGLTSHPHPVQNYEEATKQIESLSADRQSEMNPDCRLQFLSPGRKAQHVIIFVHGYTNCPAQFVELGQKFYDLGYNVLIAPLPHHGLKDRLNGEQSQLTADELMTYADRMVDIAHGLGDDITVMGISGGGVIAAWAAQNRSEVDTAVIISPAFGYQQIPKRLTAPAMNVIRILPDVFNWWNPKLREKVGPSHAYPRYSKHTLAEFLRLGFAVQVQGWQSPPAAQRLIIITNANDTSVNNEMTADVVKIWEGHRANIESYEFPSNLDLAHDLIDPEQPNQPIDIVYPTLIDLITNKK